MDFLNGFFLPPSADHLHLVKYLILLIYFIHIPFVSLLLGGTFFSIFFRLLAGHETESLYWKLSRDFIETLVFRKTAGIILGVLPILVLTLIEGQVFYDAEIYVVHFLFYTTILVALGITSVYFYQSTFRMADLHPLLQLSSGLGGLLLLLVGYFIFSVNSALVLDPGRWATVTDPTKFLFSWNVIARFVHFICAAFAVSGVAMVFFFFNWKESQKDTDESYGNTVLKIGGGIALTFTLLQPLLLFWNLITLPDPALSAAVFANTIIVLFLVLVICLLLIRLLKNAELRLGTNVFVLFVIALVFMIVSDHLAREKSIQNHTRLLVTRAEEISSEIEAERERTRAASIEPDLAVGATVFRNQCSACHGFEQKIVGPPYNAVLSKYQEDPEKLAEFIRNPYKVDESYPAMPKLGLSEKEIKSVVAYLFQEMEKQK